MKQPSIKRNIALSSAYQVLNIILPFITAPYISRVLGAEGIGVFSYTSSLNTYFCMVAALGTSVYGAREIARVRDDRKTYSKLFWEIEGLTLLTSGLALLFWLGFSLFYTTYTPFLLVLSLLILATAADISWFFTGLEQFQFLVYRNAFFKIIGVVSIFVLVNSKEDLLLYVALMSLVTLVSNLSVWYKVPQLVDWVPLRDLAIKPHFQETLIYFVPTIATSIYNVLDKTMIGLFSDSIAQNGYYDQANKIITPLKTISFAALNGVLGARTAYLFGKEAYDDVKNLIALSLEYILFMGIGVFFGLIGVSHDFVPFFFGAGFTPVTYLLIIFSPVVLIIGLSNCLGSQYYTPSGRRKESTKYIVIGAVVNLILNLIVIPRYGAYGASVSTLIAEGVISYLYVKNSQGYMTFGMVAQKSYKKVLAGGLMLLTILVLGQFLEPGALSLGIKVALGGTVYLLALVLFKDHSLSLITSRLLKGQKI